MIGTAGHLRTEEHGSEHPVLSYSSSKETLEQSDKKRERPRPGKLSSRVSISSADLGFVESGSSASPMQACPDPPGPKEEERTWRQQQQKNRCLRWISEVESRMADLRRTLNQTITEGETHPMLQGAEPHHPPQLAMGSEHFSLDTTRSSPDWPYKSDPKETDALGSSGSRRNAFRQASNAGGGGKVTTPISSKRVYHESGMFQMETALSERTAHVSSWDELDRLNGETQVFDQVYIDMALEERGAGASSPTPSGRVGHVRDDIVQGSMSMRSPGGNLRRTMSKPQQLDCSFAYVPWDISAMRRGNCREARRPCVLPILYPESKLRVAWLLIGFVFIIAEAYLIPLIVSFDIQATTDDEAFFTLMSFINTYFIFDVPINFLTGYVDNRGEIVMQPEKIAKRYASSWLLGDVLAAIPWEWILTAEEASAARFTRGFRFLRAHRLLRLTRLIQLMKLKNIMDKVDSFIEANQMVMFLLGVVSIICLLSVICHWAACLWYVMGSADSEMETWLTRCREAEGCQNMGEEYVSSLYFTLTTMTTVGFGDIAPMNYREIYFVLCLLLIASVVFAGLMGSLTDLITALNKRKHLQAQKRTTLARYMQWRGIPRCLTAQIRHYLVFLWDTNEDYEVYEEQIKKQLPPLLRMELCYHIYGAVLTHAPFLAWMKDYGECIKELALKVKSLFLTKGDILFRRGEVNEDIYIVLEGKLHLSTTNVFGKNSKDGSGANLKIPRNQNQSYLQDVLRAAEQIKAMRKAMMMKSPHEGSEVKKEARVGFAMHSVLEGENFKSEVMTAAAMELDRQDAKELKAVQLVQRRWREKRRIRLGGRPIPLHKQRSQQNMPVGGRTIEAPTYLGESCLWVPPNGAFPRHKYSARCETRGEFVHMHQHTVLDVVSLFSPWLPERFDRFVEAVRHHMQEFAEVPQTMVSSSPRGALYGKSPTVDIEMLNKDAASSEYSTHSF
mmetsp:Transcript_51933/g.121570  ORF Transcript_51933/g.121570 Transcript_51933/m.121570 type:complete len:958 (-) Transcript_51933:139-3012(-)